MTLAQEEVFQKNPKLWQRLERLRQIFLERDGATQQAEVYWSDEDDLWAYDISFARRIANKWTSVLSKLPDDFKKDLVDREWVDWGCGTGVASETLALAVGLPPHIHLWDHSDLARSYAQKKLITLGAQEVSEMKDPIHGFKGKVILASHMINELREGVKNAFLNALKEAEVVIWVEAGSRVTSQKLSHCRDVLLKGDSHFEVLLPCPQGLAKCPLSEQGSADWCHFFAVVDAEFHQSSFWREFADRMGVDLRSLPLSVLVLQKKKSIAVMDPKRHRLLGTPRVYKGYLKVQSCHGRTGVKEYTLDKRSDRALFKEIKDPEFMDLYEWNLNDDQTKIVSGQKVNENDKE